MNVLVADDDITSRTMLCAVLRKWGFNPTEAEDGVQAWSVLARPDAPKLVLLDWNMPHMDGLEVLRRLRGVQDSQPPHVILLTGKEAKRDIVEGLQAGANDYVTKPYDHDELRARLAVGKRLVELQRDLAHAAAHDPLTGVLNRGAILEMLDRELHRAVRQSTSLSLGLLDIDHFKLVNDSHGHQVGDDVLKEFTKLLNIRIRPYDYLGRYGGEEFLLVAPGRAASDARDVFDRLRAAVGDTALDTRRGPLFITVSVGVASTFGDTAPDIVLARADEALYRAKQDGRNRVVGAVAFPSDERRVLR